MKFQKLNDDVFECYISQAELIAQGIDVRDFIADREKANNFLKFVLKEANFEIGFNPEGKVLNVQISVMQDGALSLMISNENNPRVQDILGDLKSRLEYYQKIIEDDLHESPGKSVPVKPEDIEDFFNHVIKKYDQDHMDIQDKVFNDLDDQAEEDEEEETENEEAEETSDSYPEDDKAVMPEKISKVVWAAAFPDLETLLRALKKTDSEEADSDLYKYEGRYYLYVHEDGSEKIHQKLFRRLQEYAVEFKIDRIDPYPLVSEHGSCLMKGNALARLLSL